MLNPIDSLSARNLFSIRSAPARRLNACYAGLTSRKVLQQPLPFQRENTLRMKLHALDRKLPVPQAHDLLFLRQR